MITKQDAIDALGKMIDALQLTLDSAERIDQSLEESAMSLLEESDPPETLDEFREELTRIKDGCVRILSISRRGFEECKETDAQSLKAMRILKESYETEIRNTGDIAPSFSKGEQSMIQFSEVEQTTEWHPIDLGDVGSFEIEVKRPTFEELSSDQETFSGYLERRLQRGLVNWRGVEGDDGQPVPFSYETFQAFCTAHPAVFHAASAIVAQFYTGV